MTEPIDKPTEPAAVAKGRAPQVDPAAAAARDQALRQAHARPPKKARSKAPQSAPPASTPAAPSPKKD